MRKESLDCKQVNYVAVTYHGYSSPGKFLDREFWTDVELNSCAV